MTVRRTALYLAIGAATYVVALVAMAPASWVAHAIERATARTLELREPAGTAWAGSGRMVLRLRSGGLLDLGALRWNSSPVDLLTGGLKVDLALGSAAKSARLELSPGSLTVRDLHLELPATVLASVAPALEALAPEGRLVLRSDNVRLSGNAVLGLADIEWRDMHLGTAQRYALGSHVARLRGGGARVDIELASIEGPLRLSGGGAWVPGNGLTVSGIAELAAEGVAALVPFLQGVCSEYREGRCAFRVKQ